MVYLEWFEIPSSETEDEFFWNLYQGEYKYLPKQASEIYERLRQLCHNTVYPFHTFTVESELSAIEFEPVTIFYGGNGTGKTTLLNIIAERLGLNRTTAFNKSSFFDTYLMLCRAPYDAEIPQNSRIITSDDVFNYILDVRAVNESVDSRREYLFSEYEELKKRSGGYRLKSLDDYDNFCKMRKIRDMSKGKYVMSELGFNEPERSNGENAFICFTDNITNDALYLLDEPENSLSPTRQMKLARYIEDASRFYNCQFIISTHSPFLLALPYAKIYDLDKAPVSVSKWTELENTRIYFDFFEQHRNEFIEGK